MNERETHKGILKDIKREINRCKDYLTKNVKNSEKWNWRFTAIQYVILAISLGLDFAPAFIYQLQSNWYSIPTVSFSLVALLVDIHRDKKNYPENIKDDTYHIGMLESTLSSISRHCENEDSMKNISPDFIKRIQEKLAYTKTSRNIPIEEV